MAPWSEALRWPHSVRQVPLDFGGPVDIPFEPVPADKAGIAHFEVMAARHADKVAVDDGMRQFTYRQLCQSVHVLAAQLAGLPQGRPVVALLRNTASFPIVILAHLAAGRPLIPVDAGDPPERTLAILHEAAPGAILLGEGVSVPPDLFAADLPHISFDPDAPQPSPVRTYAPGLDDAAGIAYTSGSTGRPKGLVFSQRAFLMNLADYVAACHINANDSILSLASLSGAGCRDALAALSVGATVRILDIKSGGVGAVMRALHMETVTVLAFVPSVLRALMRLEGARQAFRHIRILDVFGERTTADDIALFRDILPAQCFIRLSLSSTEATDMFHWFVRPGEWPDGEAPPCGYLAHGKSVALLDEDGALASEGAPGELVVRGRAVALGNWQGGRLVQGAFIADPHDRLARIYHTGDVVRLRPDGLAVFVGRRDRQVKIRGLRADLSQIEDSLRAQQDIADAAVIVRSQDGVPTLVAYAVAARPEAPPKLACLRSRLAAELPAHMVPAELVFLRAIPRLANFKPDYVALATLRGTEPGAPGFEEAGSDIPSMQAVQHAWRAVFAGKPFAPDLALEDAGADSLRVLKLVFEIERRLGRVIPLEIFSFRMTARALAAEINRLPQVAEADRPLDDRPMIWIIAASAGDVARLAGVRQALSRWFRFDLVHMGPGVVVRDAACDIAAGNDSGMVNVLFAGSAVIARELAEQLGTMRRRVGLRLIVDDAATESDVAAPAGLPVALPRTLPATLVLPGRHLAPPFVDKLAARIVKAYSDSQQ